MLGGSLARRVSANAVATIRLRVKGAAREVSGTPHYGPRRQNSVKRNAVYTVHYFWYNDWPGHLSTLFTELSGR